MVIVLAVALTARQCRKKFSNTRFLLQLLLWVFVSQLLISAVVVAVAYGFVTMVQYWYWWMLMGAGFALSNYLLTLPLWVLAVTNSLYRQRLESCLNLKDS